MLEFSQLGCAEFALGPGRRAQVDLADLRSEDSGSEPMRFEQLALAHVTVAQLSLGRMVVSDGGSRRCGVRFGQWKAVPLSLAPLGLLPMKIGSGKV